MEEKKARLPHSLIIDSRHNITLTGVTATDNFDEEEICLYTDYGSVTIKGEGLKVNIINTESGDAEASGKINSVTYSDKASKREGFMTKVFR